MTQRRVLPPVRAVCSVSIGAYAAVFQTSTLVLGRQRRKRVKLTHDTQFYTWKGGVLSFIFTHPSKDYQKNERKKDDDSICYTSHADAAC